MPRNGSGTYTLPAGQPVVTGTVIDSTVHNTFANDVATALTGSLAANGERTASGNLPMGTYKITGLGDATTGTDALNRQTGDARYAQLATNPVFTAGAIIAAASGGSELILSDTAAASNEKRFRVVSNGGVLYVQTQNDAAAAQTTFMQVDRSGTTVDSIAFDATAITVNGVNVSDFARKSQSNIFTGAQNTLSSTDAILNFIQTGATANEGKWRLRATSDKFIVASYNDADDAAANAIVVDRSGVNISTITLSATDIVLDGAVVSSNFTVGGQVNFGAGVAGFMELVNRSGGALGLKIYHGANGTSPVTTFAADGTLTATGFVGVGTSLTSLNASNLASGTIPDARFPATLPAASGVNLTALNASNLASGTVPDARFPATLPAASGVNLTALNASNLASGTVAAARMPALTGDVTTSAGAVATTIANDAVTYAKMQNVSATSRVLGRITSGAGDVEELTAANLRTILGDSTGSFTGTLTGCTTSPTATFNYSVSNGQVFLWTTSNLTATSNASTMTITGLPAAITPAADVSANGLGDTTDGGSAILAVGIARATGVLALFPAAPASNRLVMGTWTTSATKGINAGFSMSWAKN